MKRLCLVLSLILTAGPAFAESVALVGTFEQGGLVFGRTEPGAKVTLDDKPVSVAMDGGFLFGFERDAKETAVLKIRHPDNRTETRELTIAPRQWDIRKLDGLPSNSVNPNPETVRRIKYENGLIGHARAMSKPDPFHRSGFMQPAEGRISGVFGSQSVLNGTPKSPHSGTDVAAPEGAPVMAAADGIAVLVREDMFYTGMTVMIDHGQGLLSVYAHMSALSVTEGQWVKKGQVIGAVGSTGRVTGPHLHWGVSWNSTKLDPVSVLAADKKARAAGP